MMLQYRGFTQTWRLQYLTDLTQLPDYEPGYGYEYDPRPRGAPVDPEGQPVFHRLPAHFDTAGSDGERWRWLLARAVRFNPKLKTQVDYRRASFLLQQFGVQTLASYGALYGRDRPPDQKKDTSSPYEVHTLTDAETIARLAVGVRRFDLPDEYNYLRIFKEILEGRNTGYAGLAARALATSATGNRCRW